MSLLLLFRGSGATAFTLTCAVGAFALTGNAANLAYGRVMAVTVGDYTLTGVATAFVWNRILAAAFATFSITGNDVTFVYVRPVWLAAERTVVTWTPAAD